MRPRPGRLVLMDQDITHRVSAPSVLAQHSARFSLVWKLVMHPKRGDDAAGSWAETRPSICRPEWGAPTKFGSATEAFQRSQRQR